MKLNQVEHTKEVVSVYSIRAQTRNRSTMPPTLWIGGTKEFGTLKPIRQGRFAVIRGVGLLQ